MKNAIIYTFVFLAIQVMVGFIVDGIWRWAFGKGAMNDATGIHENQMGNSTDNRPYDLQGRPVDGHRHSTLIIKRGADGRFQKVLMD